jgi:hypothetical protein
VEHLSKVSSRLTTVVSCSLSQSTELPHIPFRSQSLVVHCRFLGEVPVGEIGLKSCMAEESRRRILGDLSDRGPRSETVRRILRAMKRRGCQFTLSTQVMINSALAFALFGLPGCGEATTPPSAKPGVETSGTPSKAGPPAKGAVNSKAQKDPYADLSPREKRARKS